MFPHRTSSGVRGCCNNAYSFSSLFYRSRGNRHFSIIYLERLSRVLCSFRGFNINHVTIRYRYYICYYSLPLLYIVLLVLDKTGVVTIRHGRTPLSIIKRFNANNIERGGVFYTVNTVTTNRMLFLRRSWHRERKLVGFERSKTFKCIQFRRPTRV